jgi:hypothetical protein
VTLRGARRAGVRFGIQPSDEAGLDFLVRLDGGRSYEADFKKTTVRFAHATVRGKVSNQLLVGYETVVRILPDSHCSSSQSVAIGA